MTEVQLLQKAVALTNRVKYLEGQLKKKRRIIRDLKVDFIKVSAALSKVEMR
jgi:hypothetical protein